MRLSSRQDGCRHDATKFRQSRSSTQLTLILKNRGLLCGHLWEQPRQAAPIKASRPLLKKRAAGAPEDEMPNVYLKKAVWNMKREKFFRLMHKIWQPDDRMGGRTRTLSGNRQETVKNRKSLIFQGFKNLLIFWAD